MSQVAFVSHQHDDDVGVGMIPQLFEPSRNILIRLMFADIVHQ